MLSGSTTRVGVSGGNTRLAIEEFCDLDPRRAAFPADTALDAADCPEDAGSSKGNPEDDLVSESKCTLSTRHGEARSDIRSGIPPSGSVHFKDVGDRAVAEVVGYERPLGCIVEGVRL